MTIKTLVTILAIMEIQHGKQYILILTIKSKIQNMLTRQGNK